MSDYVPFEIQVEVIKRLPVKSLLQFRSVSKQWKSLIDSSEFIAGYQTHPQQQQQQRLLVRYTDPISNEYKYVSLVDDDTLALQNFSSTSLVLDKQVRCSETVVGSSHGLLCLYSHLKPMSGMVVLWNPSIRRSIGIAVNSVFGWTMGETVIGFGVCPTTNDPTIVKFTRRIHCLLQSSNSISVPWVVEVFSLSSGTWRIPSGKPPGGKITVTGCQVVIDKVIYLQSFYMYPKRRIVIISYDMTTEETGVIELPDCLAQQFYSNSFIYKLCESLAVLEYSKNTYTQVFVVWKMDRDVPNLFTKLFTINTPNWDLRTGHHSRSTALGFTKSGEPIMARKIDNQKPAALVVYKPGLEHIKDIGIYGRPDSFFVASYMETLLLHDQVDGRVYSSEVNKSYLNSSLL